jgi:peptidyl-dipeptidase Dcp
LQFGENVLAETQGFELHHDEDLSGLPEGTIEAARSLKSQEKRLDLHARLP